MFDCYIPGPLIEPENYVKRRNREKDRVHSQLSMLEILTITTMILKNTSFIANLLRMESFECYNC